MDTNRSKREVNGPYMFQRGGWLRWGMCIRSEEHITQVILLGTRSFQLRFDEIH